MTKVIMDKEVDMWSILDLESDIDDVLLAEYGENYERMRIRVVIEVLPDESGTN